MALLRTYKHVAQKEHWCDTCCKYIMPGEMYEGMVTVSESHGLVVFRTHVEPMCDFPEDPEDDRELAKPKGNCLEKSVKEETKKAA